LPYARSIFFFQAEDGIRDLTVTGVQTCALPIFLLFLIASTINPVFLGLSLLGLGYSAYYFLSCAAQVRLAKTLPGGMLRPWRIVDRKSVVEGKGVDLGGRRIIKKKKRE